MKQVNGIYLPDDDTHFTRYAEAGSYQQPVFTQAISHVRHREWAIDVGAHVGFWSREMAAHFARVDAFEPVPANFECLVRNVPDHVRVHPMALGDLDGEMRMRNGSNANSGAWELDRAYLDGPIRVPVHPLDSFRTWTRGTIGLIKLDVQGMEAAVLHGARTTLLRDKPVIVVEIVCHGQFDQHALDVLHSYGAQRIGAYKADWIFGWPAQ